jgi:ligand-binding sensor domain-containing protein
MNKLVAHIFFFISIAGWSQTDYRFNNFTINDGLSQSSVTCIIQDDLNSLWVGTQDGINRYDGKSFEIFNSDNTDGIRSEYVNCATKDNKGNLWFGTKGGLTTYQLASETFKTYTLPNKKAFKVESAVIDNNGVFWIASTDKGLFSFDTISKRFTSHQGR